MPIEYQLIYEDILINNLQYCVRAGVLMYWNGDGWSISRHHNTLKGRATQGDL